MPAAPRRNTATAARARSSAAQAARAAARAQASAGAPAPEPATPAEPAEPAEPAAAPAPKAAPAQASKTSKTSGAAAGAAKKGGPRKAAAPKASPAATAFRPPVQDSTTKWAPKVPETVSGAASAGGGILLGLVGYAIGISYLTNGWTGVQQWLAAKFLNRPTQGPELEGKVPGTLGSMRKGNG